MPKGTFSQGWAQMNSVIPKDQKIGITLKVKLWENVLSALKGKNLLLGSKFFPFIVDSLFRSYLHSAVAIPLNFLNCQSQQSSSALSSTCDFKSHFCKQCGPRSDCSCRSSLIRVHTVCLYAKIGLKSLQEYSADDIFRGRFS